VSSATASRRGLVRVVVNPRSGKGLAAVLGHRVACHLRTCGYDVQLLDLDGASWAHERLFRNARDLRCLIAVGGDHTISETAAVAMELQVPLLPVPAGFGNMIARSLGHRATIPFVRTVLEHGVVQGIDAGRVGRTVFLANHAFGFTEDVKTAVEATPALPRAPLQRYLHYWRAAARAIATAPLPTIRVEADGARLADDAVLVLVANVPSYRGFLALTPEASPLDGLLDVLVVPAMPKPTLAALLLAFLVHAPGRWRAVRARRAAHVRVTLAGGVERELRVLPAAVPVLLPTTVLPRTASQRMRLAG
jgi:diacylglycerol kinase (ATP)